MQLITRQVERHFESTLRRVYVALEPAAAIVERHMRGRVGELQVAVASSRGLQEMVADAHQELFGVRDQPHGRWGRHPAGMTALTSTGTLVVINAQVLGGRVKEIDKTVLHELAHAVQFARPKDRERIMRGELHNYGIEPLDRAEVRRLDRLVVADEREAARMERHYRQLAKAA